MSHERKYRPGEIVYILLRNPHVQDVANVKRAAVVEDPEQPEKLALFAHDNYYPLTNNLAVYSTEFAAETAYQEAFGLDEAEKDG